MGMIWWLDGNKWERWRNPGDSHDSCLSDWVDDIALAKKESLGGVFQKNDKELWSLVLCVKYLLDLVGEVSHSTSQVLSRPVIPPVISIPSWVPL